MVWKTRSGSCRTSGRRGCSLAGDLRRLPGLGRLPAQHPRQQTRRAGRGGRPTRRRGRSPIRRCSRSTRARTARDTHDAGAVSVGGPLHSVRGRRGLGDPSSARRGGRARSRRGHIEASSRRRLRGRRSHARVRGGLSAPAVSRMGAAERERVLAGELIDPIKVGYAESMKLSPTGRRVPRLLDLPEASPSDRDATLPIDLTQSPQVTPPSPPPLSSPLRGRRGRAAARSR